MQSIYTQSIIIDASASKIWEHLTLVDLMKQWMAEPEMKLEIITDWKVGSSFIVKGFHHIPFENSGTVLTVLPNEELCYTHSSSLSRLPDVPESYTHITFRLKPINQQTELTIELENFPNEIIYKHLVFYWRNTLGVLRQLVTSNW